MGSGTSKNEFVIREFSFKSSSICCTVNMGKITILYFRVQWRKFSDMYLCAIFVPELSLLTSIFFRAQHSELYNIVDIIFLCWLKCFLFERRLCYNDIDEMKKHILVDDHSNDFTYLSMVSGFSPEVTMGGRL